MDTLPRLEKLVAQCNNSKIDFELARKQLNITLDQIESIDDFTSIDNKEWLTQLLTSLTFFIFDKESQLLKGRVISVANKIWNNMKETHNEKGPVLNILIEKLRPHLLPTRNQKVVKQANKNVGLNPKLGLSLKEDNIREQWYKNNEFKYIGTFSFILMKLQHQDISSNLWWIIPGILNLMDDTTYFEDVKLPSIHLFYQLLECFSRNEASDGSDSTSKWISLRDTGLYDLFEPTLKNMLFFTPPSFPQEQTLKIWSSVYPVMIKLYDLEYNYPQEDSHMYYEMLINLGNEVILQHSIPRCGFKHELLLVFALNQLIDILYTIGRSGILIFQRIINVVGGSLVTDPFFTLFDSAIDMIIKLISTLIKICPEDRLMAHQFDLIGLIFIISFKCEKEGKLDSQSRLDSLQQLIHDLYTHGVDISDLKETLLENDSYKDVVIKLFT